MSSSTDTSLKLSNPFGYVDLGILAEDPGCSDNFMAGIRLEKRNLEIAFTADHEDICVRDLNHAATLFSLAKYDIAFVNSTLLCVEFPDQDKTLFLRFHNKNDAKLFKQALKMNQMRLRKSVVPKENGSSFDSRTEDNSAEAYFHFYGLLHQQQNMLQDFVRTSTYQQAFLANTIDFKDKIVMDVGAGTGILSFFAVQAGAKKVYAVEASSMASHCQELIRTNNLVDKITVLPCKVEEVDIPEKVDVIISEPMGYMLVNERMLESFVYARKFLKPTGRMFPTTSNLYFALFTDEMLFHEMFQKCTFWLHEHFFGVNLSGLRNQAYVETFKQPIVDNWHSDILCSDVQAWPFDFENDSAEKLQKIEVDFRMTATKTCFVHGVASWFDVYFNGSEKQIKLGTGPNDHPTHWYQVRSLLGDPIFVNAGQVVGGRFVMTANQRMSYDMEVVVRANGETRRNTIDLKNPHFRYGGSGAAPAEPPPPAEPPASPPAQNGCHNAMAMSCENIPVKTSL